MSEDEKEAVAQTKPGRVAVDRVGGLMQTIDKVEGKECRSKPTLGCQGDFGCEVNAKDAGEKCRRGRSK